MALALDDPPLDAIGVGGDGELVPVDALRADLAVRVAAGLAEDAVELLHVATHAVLLRVERGRAVRVLPVLLARIVAGAGRPADVLLHADVLVRVREEVVPVRRAVLHLQRELARVVVEADLAAVLRGLLGGRVVVVNEHLEEVVEVLALLREVAAAGADDRGVAVAEVELARPLHVGGAERIAADVRAAADEAVVVQHLLQLGGRLAVVARELDALVADLRDLGERLLKAHRGDVLVDGIELDGDLALLAAGQRAAGAGAESRRGTRRGQRTQETSSRQIHVCSPFRGIHLSCLQPLDANLCPDCAPTQAGPSSRRAGPSPVRPSA